MVNQRIKNYYVPQTSSTNSSKTTDLMVDPFLHQLSSVQPAGHHEPPPALPRRPRLVARLGTRHHPGVLKPATGKPQTDGGFTVANNE